MLCAVKNRSGALFPFLCKNFVRQMAQGAEWFRQDEDQNDNYSLRAGNYFVHCGSLSGVRRFGLDEGNSRYHYRSPTVPGCYGGWLSFFRDKPAFRRYLQEHQTKRACLGSEACQGHVYPAFGRYVRVGGLRHPLSF